MNAAPDTKGQRPKPVFTLRPVFDDMIAKVECAAVAAFCMTLVTLVLGVVLYLLLSLVGLGGIIRPGWVFGMLFISGLVVVPALYYETKRRAYAATVCHFYDDYLEYQNFRYLVTRQRGRVFYAAIADATQKANILQEQKHLTTILLYIPDMRDAPRGFEGLKIVDLPQTQDYLGNIIALIEASNRRGQERMDAEAAAQMQARIDAEARAAAQLQAEAAAAAIPAPPDTAE